MNLNVTYPEFNKRLAEALRSVGFYEGIHSDEYGLTVDGGHLNNYLLAALLAQLIENGHVELRVNPSIDPNKTDYLLRLLHLKERERE